MAAFGMLWAARTAFAATTYCVYPFDRKHLVLFLRRQALKPQPQSPSSFQINARASGETNDIFLVFTFASG
jgi:hypothetical protein